jgi:hypothetical protein
VDAVVEASQIGVLALIVLGLVVTLVVVWRKDHETWEDVPSIWRSARLRS